MFMEGIVLGHKNSARGIEVDKPKVDVIEKLPQPTNCQRDSELSWPCRFLPEIH